tara:strand:- start:1353 stop:1502 length:150 start_codon:yes stop_codon:yes gene_type:complete
MLTTELLHKQIKMLKQIIEDKEETIKKLRKDLSELKYTKANQTWVENDE